MLGGCCPCPTSSNLLTFCISTTLVRQARLLQGKMSAEWAANSGYCSCQTSLLSCDATSARSGSRLGAEHLTGWCILVQHFRSRAGFCCPALQEPVRSRFSLLEAQGAPLISGPELPRLTVYPEVVTDIHRWADGSNGKHSPAAAVLRLADSHGLVRGSTWCPGLVGDNTPASPALVPEPPADSFAGIDTPSDLARQASAGLALSSCFLPSFMDCASSPRSAVHQPQQDGMFVSLPDVEVQLTNHA